MYITHQKINMLCFPPAGTLAASVLRLFLQVNKKTPNLYVFDYPGRGVSLEINKPGTFDALCQKIFVETQPLIREPFILFGHSFGGYVALEIARLLQLRQNIKANAIILSGVKNIATITPETSTSLLAYNDNALLEQIGLQLPDFFMDLKGKIIEWIRQDIKLLETYRPSKFIYSSNLTIINGKHDDHVSLNNNIDSWSPMTTGECRYINIEEEHSFNINYVDAVLAVKEISDELSDELSSFTSSSATIS